MPGHWKDTHVASHEGFLEDVLLVGVVVQVALEDLAASLLLIYSPLHTIITVGYLVGRHILDRKSVV